ncbi:uncharacterized protein PHACADRAFT_67179, partial [Phanerochaete carnosa HHB-10118-sp]
QEYTVGGVYVCTDTNWQGICNHFTFAAGSCQNLPSPWRLNASSFGPDNCMQCQAYSGTNCQNPGGSSSTAPVWQFAYPGDSTGGLDSGNYWGNLIASFSCQDA